MPFPASSDIQGSPLAAWRVEGLDGEVTWSSPGLWAMAGLAAGADPGGWQEAVDPRDRPSLAALRQPGESCSVRMIRADGSVRHVVCEVVGDDLPACGDGRSQRFMVARDLTDEIAARHWRERAQDDLAAIRRAVLSARDATMSGALRDVCTMVSALLRAQRTDIHVLDESGAWPAELVRVLSASEADEVRAGQSVLVDLPGGGTLGVTPGITADRPRAIVTVLTDRATWSDQERWLIIRVATIVSDALRILEVDREQELWRTRSFAFADQSADVLFLFTPDMRPVYVNDAFEELFGRTVEEWMAGGLDADFTLVHPEDLASVENDMSTFLHQVRRDDARSAQVRMEMTYRVVRPDGSRRWVRSALFPVYDDSGQLTGIGGIGTDVTDERALLDEVVRSRDAAEESVRRMSRFVGRVLEEWQRVAQDRGDQRQLQWIDDLLALRAVTEDSDLSPEVVDLHPLLESIAGKARERHGGHVEVDAASEPVIVDRSFVELLIGSMVETAMRWRLDSVSVRTSLAGSTEASGELLIRVRGEGGPIEPSRLSRLLIPLDRIDAEDDPMLRLPLAIADACALRLHGSLDLHSALVRDRPDSARLTMSARIRCLPTA